jgi:class 3 adenylate cyclase
LRCALALTAAVRDLGVEIRVGVHTGECELIGEDVGGMAVHIASRVGALAGPGEVLVSGTVFGTVVGGPFAFEDRGFHELKGVPGRWPLFALRG